MEIKNVIGDNSPEIIEKLQGSTVINVQIEEVVTEDEDLESIRTKISEARAFVIANKEEV